MHLLVMVSSCPNILAGRSANLVDDPGTSGHHWGAVDIQMEVVPMKWSDLVSLAFRPRLKTFMTYVITMLRGG